MPSCLSLGSLDTLIENIDASLVRKEYKVATYSRYALPSLRYMLTVHDLKNTQLNDLDSKVTKYLKKWLNIPSHGAASAILYSHEGLKLHVFSFAIVQGSPRSGLRIIPVQG